ncbi:hypothetical protein C7B61_00120 [filamentous cyanobacterium CCP1]|nr:hypothetical protein C7B61_00120 [filamentous cyanobacterium CCP1]
MASGIALVIAVLAEISLGLMLLLLGSLALFTFALKWRRASRDERKIIQQKLLVGLAAGLLATAAYDLSRLIVVTVFDMDVSPFKAFPIFGQLIAGENISKSTAYVVGTFYHLFNGIFFTIAYCFAFGRRHWAYGILWALGLEFAMLALYPSWLNLEGVMQEFTVMSVAGHVAYGATLGLLCQKWLSRRPSTP